MWKLLLSFILIIGVVENCENKEKCKKCPPHEIFKYCGPTCQPTCDTIGQECTSKRHCPNECYCQKGYVRIKDGGRCIKEKCCPKKKCPKNEVYHECGPPCQNYCTPRPCMRPPKCPSACYCKAGYKRDDDTSVCIPEDQCRPFI